MDVTVSHSMGAKKSAACTCWVPWLGFVWLSTGLPLANLVRQIKLCLTGRDGDKPSVCLTASQQKDSFRSRIRSRDSCRQGDEAVLQSTDKDAWHPSKGTFQPYITDLLTLGKVIEFEALMLAKGTSV